MTTKIAISLPDEQVAEAREAVAAGSAASVSAYISDALTRTRTNAGLSAVLAQIFAEQGEPTAQETAWAEGVLGLT